MRAVFGLVLVIGLGLAGFAVFMVKGYFDKTQMELQAEREAAAQMVPTIQVIAVKEPIGYGEAITPENVQIIPYVEAFLPEGAIKTQEELFPEGIEVFRTALRPLEVNEPLTATKVTAPGEPAGISAKLEAGMRAFAINVDVSSGVSGFLRPGDRVDVYWSGSVDNGGGAPREFTKLIETSIEIIAVDQSADGSMNAAVVARTVTVQGTPQQVAALTQAQSTGKLTLSLVGAEDDVVATAVEVNQQSLLGIEAPAPAPAPQAAAPAPKVCTIMTRRGAEVVEVPIPCTN